MGRQQLARRIRRFRFGAGSLRRDVDEEFAFHLDMTVRELVASGVSPGEARREAERRFGDATRHRLACRDIGQRLRRLERRGEILTDLLMDVRFALRSFAHNPGFVAVAVITLSLGIAANSVIFGMTSALILSELPYEDADEIAVIWTTYPERGVRFNASSVPDWDAYRQGAESFEDIAVHTLWEVNLAGAEEPLGLNGYRVSGNLFEVLRREPLYGRAFVPGDDEPGAEPVVVLSWRLWQRLGGERELVGQTLLLNDTEHTVIGVMPRYFEYPLMQFRGDLWTPARFTVEQLTNARHHRYVLMMGRLAPGHDIEAANAELTRIAEQREQDYPRSNTGVRVRAVDLNYQRSEPMRAPLAVLLVAVGFVLLICCANVANLFLARTASRSGEVAIRTALGASRLRVVRQLLTESLMIAVLGGLLGYLLADLGSRLLVASLPDFVFETSGSAMDQSTDWRVALATFVLAVVAGVVFGLGPALRASRPQLRQTLSSGSSQFTGDRARHRMRSLLVVAEVAVAIVLVIGAGLMVKGFVALLGTDPGFDRNGVLTLQLVLNGPRYDEAEVRRGTYRDILQGIRAVPGVEAAGASTILPLSFGNNTGAFWIEGQPDPEPGQVPTAGYRQVVPGYLESIGVPLLAGRMLEDADRADQPAVAVVNEAFARRYLGEGSPVGQRFRSSYEGEPLEIVGVVGSMRHSSLLEPAAPAVFYPYDQADSWRRLYITARSSSDPGSIVAGVREAIHAVDPTLPVDDVQPLAEIVDDSLVVVELPANLMAVFGVCALILAAVGLYGVMSYVVAQRSREVGIRVALGASSGHVVRLVLRRALLLASIGIVIGIAIALPMGQILASVLEGVDGNELWIYAGVPTLLLVITLSACLVPLRRALRVDPVVSLRAE